MQILRQFMQILCKFMHGPLQFVQLTSKWELNIEVNIHFPESVIVNDMLIVCK